MYFKKKVSLIIIGTMMLTGCSASSNTPDDKVSGSDFKLDTYITITLYDGSDASLIDDCFDLCDKYEAMLSRTIDSSDISKLNSRETSSVSDDTLELIERGIYYGELSNGLFDITIEPLSSLWNFTADEPSIPSTTDIDLARSHVNYENISISGNNIEFADDNTRIDLGGIAKGYIADKLKEYLVSQGVTSAIISLGGNILCIGSKPDGSDFTVGIQRPFDEQNSIITSVSVSDRSVVSSGTYERYFEEDGILYHHLINPTTGYPENNELYSVTILSDMSVDGDALSTTCFLLGVDEGLELIKSIDGIDAVFITSDYEIIKSY